MRTFFLSIIVFLISCVANSQAPDLIPYRKGTQWGFVNQKKEIILPLQYQFAQPFQKGAAIVKKENKSYLIDKKGTIISSPYDSIEMRPGQESFWVLAHEYWGLVNSKGTVLIEPQFTKVQNGIIVVNAKDKNGIYCLINTTTGKYTKFHKDVECEWYQDGVARLKKNDLHGIADSTGKIIIPPNYDECWRRSDGYFTTISYKQPDASREGVQYVTFRNKTTGRMNTKRVKVVYGLFSPGGKELLKPNYDEIGLYHGGLFKVRKDQLYGFADSTGRFVIPINKYFANDFTEGLGSYCETNGSDRCMYTSKLTKVFCKPIDYSFGGYSENLCAVGQGASWGYMNRQGDIVIRQEYRDAYPFREGRALVGKMNVGFLLIDTTGKPINNDTYDYFVTLDGEKEIEPSFRGGRIFMYKRDTSNHYANARLMGVIDRSGKEIVPFKYFQIVSLGKYYKVTASIPDMRKSQSGIVDSATGKAVTELKYERIDAFKEGMALVQRTVKVPYPSRYPEQLLVGYIDSTGSEVIDIKYESAQLFSEGIVALQYNGNWGFVNKKNEMITEFKYSDSMYPYVFKNGLARVNIGGRAGIGAKTGYIDRAGVEYFED